VILSEHARLSTRQPVWKVRETKITATIHYA